MIGAIGTAIITIDNRYALRRDVRDLEQQTVETLEHLRCDIILEGLNRLEAKERFAELTPYDRVRRSQLEREARRVCTGHEPLQRSSERP